MLVLGIIAVLLVAVVVVMALFGGAGAGEPAGFDMGAVEIETNTFAVFLTGAITVVVLVAGIALIQSGLRRARRRRQQKKELNRLQKREAEVGGPAPSAADTKAPGPTGTQDATGSTETRTDTTLTDQDRPKK